MTPTASENLPKVEMIAARAALDQRPESIARGADERAIDRLRLALYDIDGLNAIPRPIPLIEGLLLHDSLAVLWGLWGTGKSFLALDFAMCVASGKPWQGREVAQGAVLYVAAEGTSGLRQRANAWQSAWPVPDRMPISFLTRAVNLRDDEQVAALAVMVSEVQPSLVVIDTLSRSLPGGDENSPKDMTAAVAAVDRLRRVSAACVLTVHHSDKGGTTSRGHGSFEGAVDTSLKVSVSGEVITLEMPKQKDGRAIMPMRLRLRPVLDSCVVDVARNGQTVALTSGLASHVLGLLDETVAAEALTTRAITMALGRSKAQTCRVLVELAKRGVIHNVGTDARPRWAITSTGQQFRLSHRLPTVSGPSHTVSSSHPPYRGRRATDTETTTPPPTWAP